MSQNDNAGSITERQQNLIEKLIAEGHTCDSTVFHEIVGKHIEVRELAQSEASDLITDLLADDESESSDAGNAEDSSAPRAPRPASAGQLKFLRDLFAQKGLARDGTIDVDELLRRLNAPNASRLIDTIKFIPQPEATQ